VDTSECVNRLRDCPPGCEPCTHFVGEEDTRGDYVSGEDEAILLVYPGPEEE